MISGMITRLSRCEAVWTSRLRAVLPPTSASPSPTSSSAMRSSLDGVVGGLAVGGVGERPPRSARRRRSPAAPRPSRCRRWRPRRRRPRPPCRRWSGRSTGLPAAPGKCSAATASPSIDSGVPRNDSAAVRPLAFRPNRPSEATQQRRAGADPDRPGARLDPRAHAGPEPGRARLGAAQRRSHRPEHPAPADDQQRRQQGHAAPGGSHRRRWRRPGRGRGSSSCPRRAGTACRGSPCRRWRGRPARPGAPPRSWPRAGRRAAAVPRGSGRPAGGRSRCRRRRPGR